jgi:hypothetical protein
MNKLDEFWQKIKLEKLREAMKPHQQGDNMGTLLDQALENVKAAVAAEEQGVANDAVEAYKASQPAPADKPAEPATPAPAVNVFTQEQYDAGIAAQKAISDVRIATLEKHNSYLEAKVTTLTQDVSALGALISKTQADISAPEDAAADAGSAAAPASV